MKSYKRPYRDDITGPYGEGRGVVKIPEVFQSSDLKNSCSFWKRTHTHTHICVESKPAIHIVQRVHLLEDTTYCMLQYIAKSHEIVQLKIKRKK